MFEAVIKATTATQLRALIKRGLDIKDHSATLDEKDFLYRVDAIISDQDKKRLESEGYTVETISDLSEIARARLNEVSRTNRFSEINTMADEQAFRVAGGYMNVEEIEQELINLNKIYSD